MEEVEVNDFEMLLSGYCNLQSSIKMMSQLKDHPILMLALGQIKEGLGEENTEGLD